LKAELAPEVTELAKLAPGHTGDPPTDTQVRGTALLGQATAELSTATQGTTTHAATQGTQGTTTGPDRHPHPATETTTEATEEVRLTE
jgi:hypothetical protein